MSSSAKATWRGAARPRADQLLVSEVFGPTVQGEGPSAGRAAAFVRLGGCNLACEWCDTAYTWDSGRHDLSRELTARSTQEVTQQALAVGAPLIVITGGEPALQSQQAAVLAREARAAGASVELETSASVPLGDLADAVTLVVASPKLAGAGQPTTARLRWDVLNAVAALPHAVFKYVVRTDEDLAEAEAVSEKLGLAASRIWIMPEATDPARLVAGLRWLAPEAASRGWSISGRLQVLLWADQRGR